MTLQPTTDWNQETFPPSPQLVAFEVVTDVDPEAWLQLTLAGTVRSPAGPATPGAPQTYTVETEKAFFIDGFYCTTECDPDSRNAVRFRTRVNVEDFAKATTVVDAASGKPIARPPASPKDKPRDDDEYDEEENALTLEDAGYQAQPPDRRYTVTISSDLKSADGQVLGYTWAGLVENWHVPRSPASATGKACGRRRRFAAAVLRPQLPGRHAVGRSGQAVRTDGRRPAQPTQQLLRATAGGRHHEKARRGRRPDPVARPRRVEGAVGRRHGRALGRRARRQLPSRAPGASRSTASR